MTPLQQRYFSFFSEGKNGFFHRQRLSSEVSVTWCYYNDANGGVPFRRLRQGASEVVGSYEEEDSAAFMYLLYPVSFSFPPAIHPSFPSLVCILTQFIFLLASPG